MEVNGVSPDGVSGTLPPQVINLSEIKLRIAKKSRIYAQRNLFISAIEFITWPIGPSWASEISTSEIQHQPRLIYHFRRSLTMQIKCLHIRMGRLYGCRLFSSL